MQNEFCPNHLRVEACNVDGPGESVNLSNSAYKSNGKHKNRFTCTARHMLHSHTQKARCDWLLRLYKVSRGRAHRHYLESIPPFRSLKPIPARHRRLPRGHPVRYMTSPAPKNDLKHAISTVMGTSPDFWVPWRRTTVTGIENVSCSVASLRYA